MILDLSTLFGINSEIMESEQEDQTTSVASGKLLRSARPRRRSVPTSFASAKIAL